jgi:hypothetical protein
MTDKALVKLDTLNDVMRLGDVFVRSGFFSDVRDANQAVVKIMAGAEMGIAPFAAMNGFNIIKGKAVPNANTLAAVVKADPRYDYRVTEHTDDACTIVFFERANGEWGEVGTSTFTRKDAKQAGLGGQNWDKYPRNMLFARAMSNGAKWFCPDAFPGPVYTADELGYDVDGETGEIINYQPPQATITKPEPQTTNGNNRPFVPSYLRDKLLERAEAHNADGPFENRTGAQGLMVGTLEKVLGDSGKEKRREVLNFVFGVTSSKDLTDAQIRALLEWLKPDDEDAKISFIQQEAAALVRAAADAQGQMDMFDGDNAADDILGPKVPVGDRNPEDFA